VNNASIDFVSAATVTDTLSPASAVRAIEVALRTEFDPATDVPRKILDVKHGQLLVMPSQLQSSVGVKVATVAPENLGRGLPRIHAVYVLFDALTLTPRVLLDGTALTTLRTPAVSVAAVKSALLAKDTALHITVFGAGPQGTGHVATIAEVVDGHRAIASVTYVVRRPTETGLPPGNLVVETRSPLAALALYRADVIVCATGAGEPLFDSTGTKSDVIVIAVGSHDADRREVDTQLVSGAQVIVEDRRTALREGGDVVMAIAESDLTADDLIPMKDVITGARPLVPDRAVFFKSSGMSWEDLVVAEAVAAQLEH
jgi:ornithine cyclodeaminase/alanine dehydrogenase-like protein (mu-crystallin family)